MTIFDLLLGMVFFIGPFAAIGAAKSAGVGAGGYVLAATVGLAIGAGCAYAMFRQGRFVWISGSKLKSRVVQRWLFGALYLSTLLWMFVADALAQWVMTRLLERLA